MTKRKYVVHVLGNGQDFNSLPMYKLELDNYCTVLKGLGYTCTIDTVGIIAESGTDSKVTAPASNAITE